MQADTGTASDRHLEACVTDVLYVLTSGYEQERQGKETDEERETHAAELESLFSLLRHQDS